MLVAGTTATLAALGAALLACAGELTPLAIGLFGLAALGGGVVLWRRRTRRSVDPASCCAGGCNAAARLPLREPAAAPKPCGCAPGACG